MKTIGRILSMWAKHGKFWRDSWHDSWRDFVAECCRMLQNVVALIG